MKRACLALASCVALAGCAPFKDVSYFAPKVSGDVAVVNTFRGLPEIATYSLATTRFRMFIFDRGPELTIVFALTDGESARFVSKQVQIVGMAGESQIVQNMEDVQANHITNGRGQFHYTSPTDLVVAASYPYKQTTIPRGVEVKVNFNQSLPPRFRVQLPDIFLSGKQYALPVVEFSRTVGSAYQGVPP